MENTFLSSAVLSAIVRGVPRDAARDTVRAGAVIVAKLAGIYRDTRTNTVMMLHISRGLLRHESGAAFLPLRDGGCPPGASHVRFTTAASGQPVWLRVATFDEDAAVHAFITAERWKPSALELARIAGAYRSEEIGVTFTASSTDTHLRTRAATIIHAAARRPPSTWGLSGSGATRRPAVIH